MVKLDRTAWLFSINSFAAALLALAIGFSLDLPRPYWAVLTVYIVSQPSSGAVRSKAIYRVIGTVLGAAFAVLTVPLLIDAPLLLSLVMSLWVGLCLGVSLLDRSPRAYTLMLAGYTAALIAFPIVGHPDQVFDYAVSRVEEIVLGILCATFTHSLIFPRPLGSMLRQRLAAWVSDADSWAHDLLAGKDPAVISDCRRHLAAAATEIHLLTTMLPFDTSHLRETTTIVRALHQRLLYLIPVLSGTGDRLGALRAAEGRLDGRVTALLARTEDWLAGGADYAAGQHLAQDIDAAAQSDRGTDWPALLRESLFTRLQDMVLCLAESHALLASLQDVPQKLPADLAENVSHQVRRPLHRDIGLAAISGASAVLSIMLVCLLWIVTGWTDGAAAAALAGVFCALFAALDDPAPAIVAFGVFNFIGTLIAALYQFAILPAIDGMAMLAVVLAPSFLLAGAFMVDRRTALPSLAIMIGLSSALALQETYSVDFAAFWNGNLAVYVGLAIALFVTRTTRSLSVERAARRLLTRTWKTLASLAHRHSAADIGDLTAEMIDRLGLLTPKLAAAGPLVGVDGESALRDVRIGMNLAFIQQHRADFEPGERAAIGDLLTHVEAHFAARSAGRPPTAGNAILAALDACLNLAARSPNRRGIGALVGLRRNMFPSAPAFAENAP